MLQFPNRNSWFDQVTLVLSEAHVEVHVVGHLTHAILEVERLKRSRDAGEVLEAVDWSSGTRKPTNGFNEVRWRVSELKIKSDNGEAFPIKYIFTNPWAYTTFADRRHG